MADIVAGFGMPHNPGAPALVVRDGPDCETARYYADMAKHIEAVAPDVLVIFTDDHFNTFFLDNFPTFAIGIAEATAGPNDQTPMPRYEVAVPGALAAHIRESAIARGFDISLVQDFEVDHAVMVPLHFITPRMQIPVRAAIEDWPQPLRVAVIGSGSFSLEIGGPKIPPGPRAAGTPDPQWSAHVQDLLREVRIGDLIAEATTARMLQAGNIGGELLDWIAMLGVIGARKPVTILPQNDHGQAFVAWRWN
jgi:Catalytic LigB subunit of aromatic ring-opening dioxygenase